MFCKSQLITCNRVKECNGVCPFEDALQHADKAQTMNEQHTVDHDREVRKMSMIDIYIRDKDSGIVRRVGDNHHDMLTINKHGQLCYCNLQNGGGCRTGEEPQDWYEFVPNEDEYGYNIDPREDGEDDV